MSVWYLFEVSYQDSNKTHTVTIPVEFDSEEMFEGLRKLSFELLEEYFNDHLTKNLEKDICVDFKTIKMLKKLSKTPDSPAILGEEITEMISLRKKWSGTRFDVIVSNNCFTQSTYISFVSIGEGKLQIPLWEPFDQRWDNSGIVILLDEAIERTREDYAKMSWHFEDDWLDWHGELEILEEHFSETTGSEIEG